MRLHKQNKVFKNLKAIVSLTLAGFCLIFTTMAQNSIVSKDTVKTRDLNDVIKKILKKKTDTTKIAKPPGFAILPSFGYNPSLGFVIGAKVAAGRQYGKPENTDYSIYGLEALYTSKGIITAQARHNVFTTGNKWNLQGNWQLSRFGLIDYGIGTGKGTYNSNGFIINEYPSKNGDSAFPIKFNYIRLSEKVYYKIGPNLFAGGGISLDIRSKIADEKQSDSFNTPHQRYNQYYGFNPKKYSANGLLLALQYNTREHPVRAYGGIYADVSLRFNQRWMGSTKNAVQLQYDFRKYWPLSTRNPEHVLAFWHWASYLLGGKLPYLELPSTGSDTYARSGRAYTIGRFKGPAYAYFETEYRFPITRDKLISGICFVNTQSASDGLGKKVFSAWDFGTGAGLRILFQKESRSTLCIDFATGNYGSKGIFFGLNEVF